MGTNTVTTQATFTQPVGVANLGVSHPLGVTDFSILELTARLLPSVSLVVHFRNMPNYFSRTATNSLISSPHTQFAAADLLRSDTRWRRYVSRRLDQLKEGRGDFTGLQRPTERVIDRAWGVTDVLFRPDTPSPSVVPSEDGDVQLIWHKAGWELEIEVGPEEVGVWARSRASGAVLSGSLGDLRVWVEDLLQLMARSDAA